jgi:hypothetical protein
MSDKLRFSDVKVDHEGPMTTANPHYGVLFGLALFILVILWLTPSLRVGPVVVH